MKKRFEMCGEIGEIKLRPRRELSLYEETRKIGEQVLVDGPEEALDTSAPTRPSGPRVNQPNLEIDAGLLDMLGNKIAAVIDIQYLRYAADRPVRAVLSPNSLA
ncbi:MAG: hypothetical protein Kow0032_07930 [Methyloligellaceae bacterium]